VTDVVSYERLGLRKKISNGKVVGYRDAVIAVAAVFLLMYNIPSTKAQTTTSRSGASSCPAGKIFDASRDLTRIAHLDANMLPNQPGVDSAPLLHAAINYVFSSNNAYSVVTADSGDYYFLSPQVDYGTNKVPKYAYVGVNGSCITVALKGASLNFAQPAYPAFYVNSWRPPKTWQFWWVCDSMNRVRIGGCECGVRLGFLTLTSGCGSSQPRATSWNG
jgi:hypothetical protein